MALTVPHSACSDQRQVRRLDKTGGATPPMSGHVGCASRGASHVTDDLFDASGGAFRIPAGASGRVQGFAGKFDSSIKGALSAP